MTLAFVDYLSSCSSSPSVMFFLKKKKYIYIYVYIYINFYSVVLISSIQQHKSAIIIHPSAPLPASLPSLIPSLQGITEHQAGLSATQQALTSYPSHT